MPYFKFLINDYYSIIYTFLIIVNNTHLDCKNCVLYRNKYSICEMWNVKTWAMAKCEKKPYSLDLWL